MSLSKITEATGLTKGAIYGHFGNKEELAMEAYRYSIRRFFMQLNAVVNQGENSLEMLLKIADFYLDYYEYSKEFGGCPILNIGVDSEHQKTGIGDLVRTYNQRILDKFSALIERGVQEGVVVESADAMLYARRFFYMIEGAVYMTYIMKDKNYLTEVAQAMTDLIHKELKK